MNSSPRRNTFHSECRKKDAEEAGRDPDTDPTVLEAIDQERLWADMVIQREADSRWRENNLEYDLRSTRWICDKAKASESYAQNIYAALCTQPWQKNDVWPLLKGETWSCTWRYAGGIVADMRQEGDYIDWYCSGIRDIDYDEDINKQWDERRYVSEGTVTEEIQNDLQQIGWAVLPEDSSPY